MTSLVEQLYSAWIEKGWTISELLDRSGLKCDRSSLHRKIHGKQKLSTDECEQLAQTLGVTIAWAPNGKRKARA